MKIAIIRSSWMKGYGYRLDTQPYVGGALQAMILLENLPLRKDRLHTLTKGHEGGIFNGPHFSRIYVEGPEYGVPFLGGSALQHSDIYNLPYLSKKLAKSNKLKFLEIKKGMTLITCSGTIGKMAYARTDMEGVWTSQHIMKIAPDKDKVLSGYLFAFLSSTFGVPLVTSGTYGSIIQSIEPEHLSDKIDVPRLDPAKEQEIHDLVEEAARLRSEANRIKKEAVDELFDITGLPLSEENIRGSSMPCSYINSSLLESRLDARFHSKNHIDAYRLVENSKFGFQTLGSLADTIIEPLRFKRVPVDESDCSVGLFGGAGILNTDPKPNYWIQPPRPLQAYQTPENSILILRSGSLNGIIGTPVLAIGDVVGSVVTEDAIRVNFTDPRTLGYAFIALHNWIGITQLKSRTYGSAIPHLDVDQIGKVILPCCPDSDFERIGMLGYSIKKLRDKAIESERSAMSKLELELTAK